MTSDASVINMSGSGPALDEDLAGPVLDALRWADPDRLGAANVPEGRVDIEIVEPFHRIWRLTHRSGGWVFIDQADALAGTTTARKAPVGQRESPW